MSTAAQKLVVPTKLWEQISTAIGGAAWNEVNVLRKAVHSAFGAAGIDATKLVEAPAIMEVPLELFNAASNYLGSKPHDAVDAVMTNIANYIKLIQQKAGEVVAAAAVPITDIPAVVAVETAPALILVPSEVEAVLPS